MSLRDQRVKFTAYLAQVITYVNNIPGIQIALDEGAITTPRMVRLNGVKTIVQDAVHIPTSYHYEGLACDLLLYRNGEYITDGNDPLWKTIDTFCRKLDPWFGLGISFNDANHVSLGEHREDPA